MAANEEIDDLIRLVPLWRGRSLRVSLLSGGLTNRNYRIDAGDEAFVLRVAGRDTALLGIDRDCEVAFTRSAASLGIGPEVIAHLPDRATLITRFVSGKLLSSADIRHEPTLRRIATTIRRYHDGATPIGSFSPFDTVRNYHALAHARGVRFPDTVTRARELLDQIEAAVRSDEPPCPCHNDLLSANFFDDGNSIQIIDWEYAGMGDRFFDLGNLAANNEFDDEHELALLDGYFGSVRPDPVRRLRWMRLASDMREAMWGFLQTAISTLDIDYMAYGQKHLDRFLATAARHNDLWS